MKNFNFPYRKLIILVTVLLTISVNAQNTKEQEISEQAIEKEIQAIEKEIKNETSVTNTANSILSRASGTTTTDGTNAGAISNYSANFGYYAGSQNNANWGTNIGALAGQYNTTGIENTNIGGQAGKYNTTGMRNTKVGYLAGFKNVSGNNNVNIGRASGFNLKGNYNTSVGTYSLYYNENGNFNVAMGYASAMKNRNNYNVAIGPYSIYNNEYGVFNTANGYGAGFNNKGSSNVFIGSYAGYNSGIKSNVLYIDNSPTETPLIYGHFTSNKVGINTNQLLTNIGGVNINAYSLFVKGGILTEEVRVRTNWADYVFDEAYTLKPLNEVEAYIKEHKHLQNVPSAKQVEDQGIEIGDITRIQQEKIEELTLYLIQLQKQVNALEQKLDNQN